jgi:sugar phosphate isomerase/epimerase
MSRRAFVAAVSCLPLCGAGSGKIRLGSYIFLKSDDPRALAREDRRLGYRAAYCPWAKVEDTARVREIEAAFASEDVIIAEVGAWRNMLEQDSTKRRANIQYVVDRLALADAVGARCCVDTAGSFASDHQPHPDDLSPRHFDATVENCRYVIDQVKPKRTKFTIEMMAWTLPDGPDSYLALLKAVDRNALGVHLDPCNAINSAAKYYHNADVITDCIHKLGPWILSCHAKDLLLSGESNIHLQEVIPGHGQVDYRTYLRELAGLGREVPLMLEHLNTAEEYEEGTKYIRRIGGEAGVEFV